MKNFHPLTAIAVTPQAARLLLPIVEMLTGKLLLSESLAQELELGKNSVVETYSNSLATAVQERWNNHQAFIFGLATGAVVRLIAPLLQGKQSDPAVLVVDAMGQSVISLLSGHQGGGDRLAQIVAEQLGGQAILTGGANGLGQIAVDCLGVPFGWRRGKGDWTGVSAALAAQKSVAVQQTAGSTLWQGHLPNGHSFNFSGTGAAVATLSITVQERDLEQQNKPRVQWHPRLLWIGLGCVRGTNLALLEQALLGVLGQENLSPLAIAGLASVDLKADEVGIQQLASKYELPFFTFAPEQLTCQSVPNPSDVVRQEVGTPSVAEAAALTAAQVYGRGGKLIVEKVIVKQDQQAVTVAIARGEREYIGKQGQLWLVGTGPGELNQISPAARTAIREADVLIGYGLYLDLIDPLRRPGQICETFPLTQERQRCQRAIELAQWGLTVAVLSSGDCGIYGMAGLVLEELEKLNWNGQTPAVEVFPGISAFQAAAARVGAPLMHDFCAISLSDLLTPKEKILQRLTAAAQADFVTALYNPKSQKRTVLIEQAQAIFLQWRSPTTPVALVRSVYRQDESIMRTTLAEMLNFPIDMLTVVLIGNSNTYNYQDYFITPRGYYANA
ncbi:precorrin-3B C(17)-methyltransferase [Synechocystis sp. CS-94]|uniref:precorrin-3B C(17)-methyltransferase n=1 Tax=unclassified Synechocystis TaxID=2640012 RepID=UPI0004D1D026|nr:precorrin-3B C(17)-methyltransferase [Synechocystis sp. CS-94]AIE74475.1 Cobalamin biosynthesis protein CbiG / Cobalt-precorrin-3b C17-methyltransferase [Synechocystis sp. PCC 6714]